MGAGCVQEVALPCGLGEEEELKTETKDLLQKRSDEIPESVMCWKPSEERKCDGLSQILHIRQVTQGL